MKMVTNLILGASLLLSTHAQAEVKGHLSCRDYQSGAKLATYRTQSGDIAFNVAFCSDGRVDTNCLVYGDYQKHEIIDTSIPGNTAFSFIHGSIRLFHFSGAYHFYDSERSASFIFADRFCTKK